MQWKESVLKRNNPYPLADHPSMEECKGTSYQHVRACWMGEHRPPKKGEWYLSGAIIEAYKAKNDLTQSYPIAKLVKVKTVEMVEAL